MKTLITGAHGFLGKYFLEELKKNEFDSLGKSALNSIRYDMTQKLAPLGYYDLVIHIAGKAHSIPKTQVEIQDFFRVNRDGTKNLLDALELAKPKKFVLISSVAVYGDDLVGEVDESSDLIGVTPYAKSKIAAEKIVLEWCLKNEVSFLILRLPLVCGINPPGNLKAMARAIQKGYYFRIGNGLAKKSMVAAKDVAKLVLSDSWKPGVYNLTDGIHPSIKETDSHIAEQFRKSVRSLPISFISIIAKVGDVVPFFPLNSLRFNKLNSSLTFSDKKAREHLNWSPSSALKSLYFSDEA